MSSLCWPRRTQWPQRRHTGWRFPYSGLWICLQKPALAASWQRGMVVKAAGCAGQGILILAWLETRDHFQRWLTIPNQAEGSRRIPISFQDAQQYTWFPCLCPVKTTYPPVYDVD